MSAPERDAVETAPLGAFDLKFIDKTLGGSPKPLQRITISGPGVAGALTLAGIYFALFVIGPFVYGASIGEKPDLTLVSLSLWGTFYLFFAAFIAKMAAKRIEAGFTPLRWAGAGSDWAKEADREISKRFRGWLPDLIAFPISAFWLALTIIALARDKTEIRIYDWPRFLPERLNEFLETVTEVKPAPAVWEWAFFGASFLVLYVVSARTTFVATFLLSITGRITADNIKASYDPWQAQLMRNCLDIARTILFFWAGISLSVASLPIFFSQYPNFIVFVVSVSMYFSLIVGTIVFIISEQQLRRLVRDATGQKLEVLSAEIVEQMSANPLDEEAKRKHDMLKTQFDHLTAAKGNTSYLITVASLILPLVGTLVRILVDWAKA